jgi:hypothetical protein
MENILLAFVYFGTFGEIIHYLQFNINCVNVIVFVVVYLVNNSLLDIDQYCAFLKIVIGKSILIDFFKNRFYEDRYDIRLKIYFWYI